MEISEALIKRTLIDARELIKDERAWIQGWAALCNENKPCAPEDDDAVRWCALGAIEKVAMSYVGVYDVVDSVDVACVLSNGACEHLDDTICDLSERHYSTTTFNDGMPHGTVLVMMQHAINRL